MQLDGAHKQLRPADRGATRRRTLHYPLLWGRTLNTLHRWTATANSSSGNEKTWLCEGVIPPARARGAIRPVDSAGNCIYPPSLTHSNSRSTVTDCTRVLVIHPATHTTTPRLRVTHPLWGVPVGLTGKSMIPSRYVCYAAEGLRLITTGYRGQSDSLPGKTTRQTVRFCPVNQILHAWLVHGFNHITVYHISMHLTQQLYSSDRLC